MIEIGIPTAKSIQEHIKVIDYIQFYMAQE